MMSTESSYDGLRRRASLALLVLVNLLPLVGVLYFDWDVAGLMVLYWSENLVLGFYTLAKMLIISPLGGLGLGTFFCIHYGGFCAGHGLFIITLLLDQNIEAMISTESSYDGLRRRASLAIHGPCSWSSPSC